MNELDLFNCRRVPARLTIEQVALLLGFQVYEILILVRQGKIKTVNYQSRNSRKFFHGKYILALVEDGDFIEKASKTVAKTVRENNRKANDAHPTEPQKLFANQIAPQRDRLNATTLPVGA